MNSGISSLKRSTSGASWKTSPSRGGITSIGGVTGPGDTVFVLVVVLLSVGDIIVSDVVSIWVEGPALPGGVGALLAPGHTPAAVSGGVSRSKLWYCLWAANNPGAGGLITLGGVTARTLPVLLLYSGVTCLPNSLFGDGGYS